MNRPCAIWASAPELPPANATAPVRSFRFMKTSTGRYWSARRSDHQLFGRGEVRQSQTYQRPHTFAAVDHHLCRVAVEDLQALGDVCHANSSASDSGGLSEQLGGTHAHAV